MREGHVNAVDASTSINGGRAVYCIPGGAHGLGRIGVGFSFILLLSFFASEAMGGIPSGENSIAVAASCGRVTIAPGGGERLHAPETGNDYRIYLTILDEAGQPVENVSMTDLYLSNPSLVFCQYARCWADGPTDAGGNTTFSGKLFGGVPDTPGYDCNSDSYLFVMFGDIVLNNFNPVCVSVDSPDLNGDLVVDTVDWARFAAAMNAPYNPCMDYDESGAVNIADFGIFGGYFNGSTCP